MEHLANINGGSAFEPKDVQIGPGWTSQMREMADHIGAYRTLLVSAHFGRQQVYIAADPRRSPLTPLIGTQASQTLSHVYRGERSSVPRASHALRVAQRHRVLRAVREGRLSKTEAARLIGSSRTYVSHLVNHSREGLAKHG